VLNKNDKLLVLRAENGSEELTAEFRKAMVDFDDIKIYDTVSAGKPTACDTYYITFASSSGVAAFFENGGELNNSKAVCIGEITARAFEKYSDVKPLIAKKHTSKGIISVITEDRNEKV
jgi:uroporphyrinogen III methyltransferase/synthase